MGRFASGVTVVTTVDAEGHPSGITVSAFSSLSLDPPLALVCIDKRAPACAAISASGVFAVNVLADDQQALSQQFASRVEDRFSGVAWEAGPATGCPLLAGTLAAMECRVHEIFPGGDHDIFVGELVATSAAEGRPLAYWLGSYGDVTQRAR